MDIVRDRLEALYPRLVEFRHELHAHPELSGREGETSRRVRGWLEGVGGLEIRTGLAGGNGLMAALRGARAGPTIALRADMDGLAIQEESGLPWASRNPGVMHACGHDGHTACLVGAAMVLASMSDQLAGEIRFLFQPAEEGGAGAAAMVADGVLDPGASGPVRAIFGLHGWPGRKVGHVATRPGPLMASTDMLQATLHGRGAHGAYPHMAIDPVLTAAYVITALQAVVARTVDPIKSAVVTVSRISGGSAVNVIPDTVELAGTIRALDGQVRQHVVRQVEQVIVQTAAAHGARAEVRIAPGYPVVVNDERMTRVVIDTAVGLLGEDRCTAEASPSMGGEDFAYYLQKVPGCFFFIGTCPPDRGEYPPVHTSRYDFTDEAIRTGVRMLCELAVRCGCEERGAADERR